jgi:hypothetical protein
MKLENNWKNKTLENLEKNKWPDKIEFDSYLVRTATALRKKPLNTFTIEDLRIMIGQNFSLDYLIPLAIEKLDEDLFARGDFYEGDLLQNVLKIETGFWRHNEAIWLMLYNLIKGRMKELARKKIDVTSFINAKTVVEK